MHTLPKPRSPRPPSGFDAFLRIARRGVPFTAVGGRAFMTVPALFSGYHTFPIRSRAFRQWFFDQCLSDYETIPTAQTFSAILRYLDAHAARDPTPAAFASPTASIPAAPSPLPKRSSSTSLIPRASSSKSLPMAGTSPPAKASPSRLPPPPVRSPPPNPPAIPIPKWVHPSTSCAPR